MTEGKTGTERRVLQGYVTNVAFGGLRVPAPMQNLMLRDYAARKNLLFKLSVGEYSFPGCFLQLDGLLSQAVKFEGIAMCSMFMLPRRAEKRKQVYETLIANGTALHLVLENLVVRRWEEAEYLEEIISLNQYIERAPARIPDELLPRLNVIDSFT